MTPISNGHRFIAILRYLHFSDHTEPAEDECLYKINSIIRNIKRKFFESFHSYQNLYIDESLVLFKGRLAFRQYIPLKRNRYEIKLFLICDCLTGYIFRFHYLY